MKMKTTTLLLVSSLLVGVNSLAADSKTTTKPYSASEQGMGTSPYSTKEQGMGTATTPNAETPTPMTTAEDQGTSDKDMALTRQIRQEIMKNDKLSTRAQNIQIITQEGKVTLRGGVASMSESATIERIAKKAAGKTQVINETVIEK